MDIIKRFITILLLIGTLMSLAITTSAISGWTDKQDKAHEIAEIARSIGLPEDDPIIRRASEIWWQEHDAEQERLKAEAEKEKRVSIGTCYITGYDNCVQCCGKWAGGPTASGVMPTVNHTVAMASDYPFGTKIYIEGLGYYTVEDRGVGYKYTNGVRYPWVDVFCNNHAECFALTGYYEVYLVEGGK